MKPERRNPKPRRRRPIVNPLRAIGLDQRKLRRQGWFHHRRLFHQKPRQSPIRLRQRNLNPPPTPSRRRKLHRRPRQQSSQRHRIQRYCPKPPRKNSPPPTQNPPPTPHIHIP